MRFLAIDVGDARMGLALSDATGSIAAPLKQIEVKGKGQAIEEIAGVIRDRGVDGVVVGMPVSLSGCLGPQARKVERFCEALQARLPVPVIKWDESFSSRQADTFMSQSGTRRTRRKGQRDSVAAAVILQEYLDSLESKPTLTGQTGGPANPSTLSA